MPVKPRILVVDDDAGLRVSLMKFLRLCGYDTETAEDGDVAVERFRQEPFDLVILDLIMPEKEGLQTLMELRAFQPDAKIIAISGGGRIQAGDYLPLARLLGAVATLEKPFWQADILRAVRKALGHGTEPAAEPEGFIRKDERVFTP